jgi:nucleoside-diphosphate-sugar epimerase
VEHDLPAHAGEVRRLAIQRRADRAVNFGALGTEELGEVGAILTRSCLDVRRAREQLGWESEVELRDGLRMTLDATRALWPQ